MARNSRNPNPSAANPTRGTPAQKAGNMSANTISEADAIFTNAANTLLDIPSMPQDADLDTVQKWAATVQRITAHNIRVKHGAELERREAERAAKAKAEEGIRKAAKERYDATGKDSGKLLGMFGRCIIEVAGGSTEAAADWMNRFLWSGPTNDSVNKAGEFVPGEPDGHYKASRSFGYGARKSAGRVLEFGGRKFVVSVKEVNEDDANGDEEDETVPE